MSSSRNLAIVLLVLQYAFSCLARAPGSSVATSAGSQSEELQAYVLSRYDELYPLSDGRDLSVAQRAAQRALTFTGRIWSKAAVATFPAECLLWLDVIKPIREHGHLPPDSTAYEPTDGEWGTMAILVEYSAHDYPETPDVSTANFAHGLVPFRYFLSAPGEYTWARVKCGESTATRATLLLNRAVRHRPTGRVGTLRVFETFILEKNDKSKTFRWSARFSDSEFVPAAATAGLSTRVENTQGRSFRSKLDGVTSQKGH